MACFLLVNEWEQRNINNGPNAAVCTLLNLIYFSQQLCTTLNIYFKGIFLNHTSMGEIIHTH